MESLSPLHALRTTSGACPKGKPRAPADRGGAEGRRFGGGGGRANSWWVPLPCPRSGEGAVRSDGQPHPPAQSAGGAGGRWRPSETTPRKGGMEGGTEGEGKEGGRTRGESGEAEEEGAVRESGGARGSSLASGGGRAAPAAWGFTVGRGGENGRARGGSASRRPPRLGRLLPRYIGEGGVTEGGAARRGQSARGGDASCQGSAQVTGASSMPIS